MAQPAAQAPPATPSEEQPVEQPGKGVGQASAGVQSEEEKTAEEQKSPEELKKEELKQALRRLKDVGRPQYRPATFWRRCAAFVLDGVTPLATAAILYFLIVFISPGAGTSETAQAVGLAIGITAGVVVFWLYNALAESGYKQATPGKDALAIKVVAQSGDHISFDKATARTFGKIISALLLCVGFLMCLFTKNKQCLHDKMAACQVVYDDK